MRTCERASKWAVFCIFLAASLLFNATQTQAGAILLHTYNNALGFEITPVIALSGAQLNLLLPAGYNLVPASALGVGGSDQGLVAMVNFKGLDQATDGGQPHDQTAIDIAILVTEPAPAMQAGVSIAGAFHLYTLAIYTDDARYAASLTDAGMPVEFVNNIDYRRAIDDASGIGNAVVTVPSATAPFKTIASALGYSPAAGGLNAVFWYEGQRGTAVLHYHGEPFQQGNAVAEIFTATQSRWDELLSNGGLGPCSHPADPGFSCMTAPALNFRYDEGTDGRLLLVNAIPEPTAVGVSLIGLAVLVTGLLRRKGAGAFGDR